MVLYLEITQLFQTNCVSTVMTGSYSEDRPSEVVWQKRRGVVRRQHVKVCEETLFFMYFMLYTNGYSSTKRCARYIWRSVKLL